MSKSQQLKNCPAVRAEPSWHFSPRCIPFKVQDFKECAFQPLPQAHTGKAEAEGAVCTVRCVFLLTLPCLSRLAYGLLPAGAFPRQRGLGWRAVKGNTLWKEGERKVLRSSYPENSLNIIWSGLWWVYTYKGKCCPASEIHRSALWCVQSSSLKVA